MQRVARSLVAMSAVTVLAVGCGGQTVTDGSPEPAVAAAQYAADISEGIQTDAMMAHLTRLQEIADQHGGNRALGTPGYQASVDYVVNMLRDKGFEVQTPEFEVRIPFAEEPSVEPGVGEVITALAVAPPPR